MTTIAANTPLPGALSRRCIGWSALAIPLVDAGEAVGALILLRNPAHQAFRADEVARAHTFGHLAALAFGKAHLLQDSEHRRIELERVLESRTRLIRGFTHYVKNPLGAVDGYLQLLEAELQGALTPKQRESVGNTRRALRTALGLVDDMLELARAEAGQLEIEQQPTDVREVAREVAEEYRAQAEAAALTLTFETARELPIIESDVSRVRQVLGNLVANAVKHTPGPGRITVRVLTRDGEPAPWRWVAVRVHNSGPEIPQDQRERIFEEFVRLEPGTRPGQGLGLPISRQVARALGGDLIVESDGGQGATFTLFLPLGPPRSAHQ